MLIDRLQRHTGLSRSQLDQFAKTASRRYKSYPIPKRSGGIRMIHQPSADIKAIQRWLNRAIFNKLPTHESATAYKAGSSIRMNAQRHKSTLFTTRIDLEDYFPSFKSQGVDRFLRDCNHAHDLGMTEDDLSFVKSIVLRNGELTIGAPSSPILTNVMMYKFDYEMSKWCIDNDLIYTRYADDMFISAKKPNCLHGVMPRVEELLKSYLYANLIINRKKTANLSKRYKRSITGIILTSDGKLSIGRDRKRLIRSMLHEYAIGKLDVDKLSILQGKLAFASDADPAFYETLARKHGGDLLAKVRAA